MSSAVHIVGAGPGGLATAILLASQGAEVHIFERRSGVGGRTGSLQAEGFKFDLGPTFFMYPEILEEIYAVAGRRLRDEVELVKLDPQYRLIFEGGGEIAATPDLDRMEEQVAGISPRDAKALGAYFRENRAKLDAFKPVLQRAFNGWKDLADPSMLGALSHLRPWNSLDRELRRHFRDPRIRLAFSFQSKYLGMSPFRCPSLFSILSFLEYEYGVFHPVGGCAALTESMAEVARDLGVQIHLDEPVDDILFEGKKAVGLRAHRGEHRGGALVINADFARAMKKLVPDRLRRRWTDRKLEKKSYSCSTFMLYLGVEGRYDHLDHHNIYMSQDYRRNLDEIENQHCLSDNPSFYVQNASVTDPTLAPEGMSTLYVLVPVTHQHGNVDWSVEAPRYRERVLDRLSAVGLGDLRSRIRYEKMVTPADWENDHQIHLGATFNLAHNYRQMLHLRPRNRFEDLENVYLVGGGTHPGSGLPVIFESARISSRLLMEDLGMAVESDARETSPEGAVAGQLEPIGAA